MPVVDLTPHPSTPAAAARRLTVDVGRVADDRLALAYRLEGELDDVRLPPPRPSRRADGLWRHTCFEAFVAVADGGDYHEFNLSPSGEWAVYAFRAYRDALPLPAETLVPHLVVRRAPDRLALDAVIPLPGAADGGTSLRLGLSAVVEAADGTLSYWALRHPPGAPDFHHADGFALALEREGSVP